MNICGMAQRVTRVTISCQERRPKRARLIGNSITNNNMKLFHHADDELKLASLAPFVTDGSKWPRCIRTRLSLMLHTAFLSGPPSVCDPPDGFDTAAHTMSKVQ